MKCPRCGHEMVLDSHRKIDLNMCYECGYIEGRQIEEPVPCRTETNYERLRSLNFNEAVAFMASGLNIDTGKLTSWLDSAIA